MKLSNEKDLNLIRSLDFTSSKHIGIVLKTSEELGENRLGLYIPKLMLGIECSKDPKEETEEIKFDKIVNSENNIIGESSIKSRNYIELMGINIPNMTPPAFGKYEKVLVSMIDGDIKSMYYETQTFANPGKRESDRFRIGAISSNIQQKNTDVESSRNNFYHMEFDTDNQRIVIQNSIVNGEKFQFTILLDAKNGTLSLTDGKRMVAINSNDDRITLQNEADSIITMVEDTINIQTKKLNINADEEINIKTKKYNLETNNFVEKSSDAKVEHKSFEQTSTKGVYNIDMKEESNKLNKITVPVLDLQVTGVACKGLVAATGLTTAPTPPTPSAMPSLPPGHSVSEMGVSTIKSGTNIVNSNAGAMPLARAHILQNILTRICIEIDKAQLAGKLPPTASLTIIPGLPGISSSSVMGS